MIASYSVACGPPEGVFAVARDVGGHALLPKAAPDQAGHLEVVFNDQDAHCLIPRERGAAR